jgi:hypothetical protein
MSGEKQKLYADLLYVGAAVRRFDLLAKLLISVAVAVALAFDFDLLPLSQRPNAGIAQGAPAMDGRWRRAPGAMPE